MGFVVVKGSHDRPPRWLGKQNQRVQVRDDADFVALDLIEAAAFVLTFGGGQAGGAFDFALAALLPFQTVA